MRIRTARTALAAGLIAVSAVGRTGEAITLNVPSAEADSAIAGLLKGGASIRKVESSLEAAFLSFYGGEK